MNGYVSATRYISSGQCPGRTRPDDRPRGYSGENSYGASTIEKMGGQRVISPDLMYVVRYRACRRGDHGARHVAGA